MQLYIALVQYALFLSTFFGGYTVATQYGTIDPGRSSAYFIAAPSLLIGCIIALHRKRKAPMIFPLSDLLYVAWPACALISLVSRPDANQFVTSYLAICTPVIGFLVFRYSDIGTRIILRHINQVLFSVSTIAIITFVVAELTHSPAMSGFVQGARETLTMREPNIYGSEVAALILLSLNRPPSLFSWATRILGIAALAISLSKGPYIAFLSGVALYTILRRNKLRVNGTSLLLSLFAVVAVGLLCFVSFTDLYARFLEHTDSTRIRQLVLRTAWDGVFRAPLLGHGPLAFSKDESFSLLTAIGSTNKQDLWIWQMFVAIAYDAGALGVTIFFSFVVSILYQGSTLCFRQPEFGREHAAATAAFFSIVVSSQFTTVHHDLIFGISAGMAVAVFRSSRQSTVKRRKQVLSSGSARSKELREHSYLNFRRSDT